MSRRIVVRREAGREPELSYSGPPPPGGTVLCLLDGQIDNRAELAVALGPAAGVAGEEELLAYGYRRWGAGLPARLRGDFVLVLWDREAGAGLIARDQLGARPAYLYRRGAMLLVATELPALLAELPRRPPPDRASVAHWIAASSRPGAQTLYAGVERLPAATMLLLDRNGARAVRYWEPRFEEPPALAADELVERVRAGLELAVRRRLAAAAPTAVLLSGGLDSAAVAAVAVAVGGEVRACSGTFPDDPVADEAELIAELRRGLGVRGPLAEVRAQGVLASAEEHLAACGLPLLSWGDFWTLPLLRAAAAEGAATVLGGDGGDELFAPRQNLIADALRRGRLRQALALAGELPGAGPELPRRQLARMLGSQALVALPHAPQARLSRWRERRRLPSWLRPASAEELLGSDDPLAWKRLEGPLWWAEPAHGIARGLDEIGIFEHQHQRAVRVGIEARHPLLDLDLVELCLRQPPRATLDRRFTRPLLRAAVAGIVPDSVRLRPRKARFEGLVASSLSGPDLPALRALLLDPGARLREYVDQEVLRRQLFDGDGPLAYGGFHWMWFSWRLATAELWLRAEHQWGAPPDPAPTNTVMAPT